MAPDQNSTSAERGSATEMLTDHEREQLLRVQKEKDDYARKALSHLRPAKKKEPGTPEAE